MILISIFYQLLLGQEQNASFTVSPQQNFSSEYSNSDILVKLF